MSNIVECLRDACGDNAGLCYEAADEIKRLREALDRLLNVKRMADGGNPLLSNQGQALDGYSELANYRRILEGVADAQL